ncbi:hypothetical protein [Compostimonas suwonensis]|uniref:hypothetical protein n=1 Tax=Compostimonas suwonensis TaxID=1048394 RepID=UPI0012FD8ABD|nr:hypothetical protein [Compostimonas suwonensis]
MHKVVTPDIELVSVGLVVSAWLSGALPGCSWRSRSAAAHLDGRTLLQGHPAAEAVAVP